MTINYFSYRIIYCKKPITADVYNYFAYYNKDSLRKINVFQIKKKRKLKKSENISY